MKNTIFSLTRATFVSFIFSFFIFNFVSAQTDRTVTYRDTTFSGKYVSQDVADPVEMAPGEVKDVTITFKNTGKSTWVNTGKHYVTAYTVNPRYIASNFADKTWIGNNNPAKINKNAKTGETTSLTIRLHAPQRVATYKEEFTMVVENSTWIKGTYFYLLIKVVPTSTPEVTTSADTTTMLDDSASTTIEAVVATQTPRDLIAQPHIRVGLYTTKEKVQFTSESTYDVLSGGDIKGSVSGGALVSLSYDGTYHFTSRDLSFDSPSYIQMIPQSSDSFFSILNYYHTVLGRGITNYNVFRGGLEYRLSPKSGNVYVINELPLDQYVRGLAETNNESAVEYLRAIVIAARTYGYMHIAPPSNAHIFDVVPTTADQLYLGYYSEALMPNVMQAVNDTEGQIVTYEGKPITTYYFGHSNGKTKDGGAARPWLKSVVAIYDRGRAMYGHGYGMSCSDAAMHAVKDGWTYSEILTYYYSGTKVEKFY